MLLSAPQSSCSIPSSRAEILADGGQIAPAEAAGAGLDVDLIVRDRRAGDNRWKTYATSRHDLQRACKFMDVLEDVPVTAEERLTLVLPPEQVDAEAMQLLMDALDDETHPTAANSVEVATLIDYLCPTEKSRWNRLLRDCKASFEATPITDDNWLRQLDRVACAPSAVVEGWSEAIARHVGGKPSLRKDSLVCNVEQMRHLLTSRTLPLDEPARYLWAKDYAKHQKEAHESGGDFLRRTGLNASLCWLALPTQDVHTAWQEHTLTDAQFMNLLAHSKGAQEGYTLPTPAFGRGREPTTSGLGEVAVFEIPANRSFQATLSLPNFPELYRGQPLRGPTFQAAGNTWRIDVLAKGVELAAVSGPCFRGRPQYGMWDASYGGWRMTDRYEAKTFEPPDAPLPVQGSHSGVYCTWGGIRSGLSIDALRLGSSPELGAGRKLQVSVGLEY